MKLPVRWLLAFIVLLGSATPLLAQNSPETAGLLLQPVDRSMSPEFVMVHRPFVAPESPVPAFDFDATATEPIDELAARNELERFLQRRDLPQRTLDAALEQFDDPAIQQIVPPPNLRAALLMLTDWEPYRSTLVAILDGRNESGLPFEAVDFRPLEFGTAMATLQIGFTSNQVRLLISDRYQNEPPTQLIPVLIHESMHDGIDNSAEEEIIASVLDSLSYAEMLSVDPDAARADTELTAYNNVQLLALLNSIGRRGAGSIGIETSFDGDVYLGPGLESFDADSIRAGIARDPWYAQLPTGGSAGGEVLESLLGRFPESISLVAPDRFSAEALAMIDQEIGGVITPEIVQLLAIALGLSLVLGEDTPPPAQISSPSIANFPNRPFRPSNPDLFDLRAMQPSPAPLDREFARAALGEALLRAGLSPAKRTALLTQYDDPALVELVTDSALRAGLLMLGQDDRWEPIMVSVITGANDSGLPVHIAFRDLPNAVPAIWDATGWNGRSVIWVHSMLKGERPELLATAIVEGALLESETPGRSQIIIATALASSFWSALIIDDPGLAHSPTWGAIIRNRDLLALLNSQLFDPGDPTSDAIGLRLGTGNGDIFPGLPLSSTSFVSWVETSPRMAPHDLPESGPIPSVLTALLDSAGIEPASISPVLDQPFLADFDHEFSRLVPIEQAVMIAITLDLVITP